MQTLLSQLGVWSGGYALLAVAVLLVGVSSTVMLAPHLRAVGRAALFWHLGIAWCLGFCLWAAQFVLGLILVPPQILHYDVWLTFVALIFAVSGAGATMGLLRARMVLAATLVLGLSFTALQLTQFSGFPQGLQFRPVELIGVAAAALGAGGLLVLAVRMSANWSAPWRAAVGVGSAVAFVAAQILAFYLPQSLQAGTVPGEAMQQVWFGTAVGIGALIQVTLILVIDRVEARLEGGLRQAWVELEDARAHLARETGQRREMAVALAENEERFRSAFDEAATGMSLLGADGAWLRVNRELCEFLGGYTQEELLRLSFGDVTHAEDVVVIQAGLQRLARGEGESFTHLTRCIRRDGTVAFGDLRVAVARRERGKVREYVGQVLDITARTRMEADLAESEGRFRSAFEDAAVAMALVGTEGAFVGSFIRVNRALCELLGYTAEELLRTNNQAFIPREDVDAVLAAAQRVLTESGPGGFRVETRYLRRDRQIVWVRLNVSLVRGADSAPLYFVGQYEDITERKLAVEALERANLDLARNVREQEEEGRGLHLLSELGQLLQSCNSLEEAYGVVRRFGPRLLPGSDAQLYAMPPSRVFLEQAIGWGSASQTPAVVGMDQCWALRRGQPHAVRDVAHDLACPHADGRPPVPSLCLPLVAQNDTLGLLWLEFPGATDVSPRVTLLARGIADRLALGLANLRLRQTLRDQSIRDLLTGLYNRRFLEESLVRELARSSRNGSPLAVVMFDVDHFKRFNDLYGHDAGDRALRAVGEVLRDQVRVSDIACRYGGEEFMLLLPDTALEAGCERARSLADAIAAMGDKKTALAAPLTISAGVAVYPANGKDPATLVRAADEALYAAKAAGRNRVHRAEAA